MTTRCRRHHGWGVGLRSRSRPTGAPTHGMDVALLDLDGDRAAAEATSLAGSFGVDGFGLGVDVGDAESVEAAATAVEDRFGRADLVVSNVGVQLFGAVDRITDDEWRWVLDVNVIGSARVARCFVPLLRRSTGRLAFTSSSSVLDPASRLGAYQASKFAVWGLAETLRLELERGRDRGVGHLPVGDDLAAPRDERGRAPGAPATAHRRRRGLRGHGRQQPGHGRGRRDSGGSGATGARSASRG